MVQVTGPRIAQLREGLSSGDPELSWTVDVPCGRLTVALSVAASLLTGSAVLVAGQLDPDWLAADAAAPALARRA